MTPPRGDELSPRAAAPQALSDSATGPSYPAQRLATARAGLNRATTDSCCGRRRFGQWLNRSRRVLLTLTLVWVVGVFDLGYTLSEWGTQDFVELNPLAVKLLSGSAHLMATFKFGLLGLGTLILLALRRHAVAELACWFLFAVQTYIAVRWFAYFDCLARDHVNPLIAVH